MVCYIVFFFKQKTAYEMRISDWSSDVCSSDLIVSPTVSINLENDATYIKEDSLDNVVEFAAATGDASDELTTVVITFPSKIEAGHLDFSSVAGDSAVSNVDINDNGGVGPVVVTIDRKRRRLKSST